MPQTSPAVPPANSGDNPQRAFLFRRENERLFNGMSGAKAIGRGYGNHSAAMRRLPEDMVITIPLHHPFPCRAVPVARERSRTAENPNRLYP